MNTEGQVLLGTADDGIPPSGLVSAPVPPLPEGGQIVCLGSRLAPALGAVLETRGYRRIRTDMPHPALPAIEPEAADYSAFGLLTGPTGSATAIEQLIRRCAGAFTPAEDRWHVGDLVIDPFRPNLRYPARSDREFDVLTERYLTGVRTALRRAQAVVIAIDTIEICEAIADGAVLPVWPEPLDPERHRIRTLTLKEASDQIHIAVQALRRINPDVHVLLMISPEPAAATTSPLHVWVADSLAKATLRLAVERALASTGVFYLPALELASHMGVAAEAVNQDARFLSALAEAVISARIVAPTLDAPAEQTDVKAPAVDRKAARAARDAARSEPASVAGKRRGAAATPEIPAGPADAGRAPVTERRAQRRDARLAKAQSTDGKVNLENAAPTATVSVEIESTPVAAKRTRARGARAGSAASTVAGATAAQSAASTSGTDGRASIAAERSRRRLVRAAAAAQAETEKPEIAAPAARPSTEGTSRRRRGQGAATAPSDDPTPTKSQRAERPAGAGRARRKARAAAADADALPPASAAPADEPRGGESAPSSRRRTADAARSDGTNSRRNARRRTDV